MKTARQAGFSLLEMVISAGLIGVIAMMTATYLAKITGAGKYEAGRSVQASIVERLNLVASNPDTLRASADNAGAPPSAPANFLLRTCVDPTQICPAVVTGAALQKSFDMWVQLGDRMDRLAGSEGNPVLYSEKGEQDCDPAAESCRFGAIAYFWATCPIVPPATLPAATCNLPLSLHVRFKVIPIKPVRDGSSYPQVPPASEFDGDKTLFAVTVPTADVIQKAADSCMPGQRQVGYDQFGKVVCKCFVDATSPTGAVIKDGFGRPVCGKQICPDGADGEPTTMAGYQNDGRIRCVGKESAEKCWEISLQKDGDCGVGAWMVRIDYGKCYARDGAKYGKGGGEIVDCENDKGLCCRETL